MARGRHKSGCGKSFPCPTGAHSPDVIRQKLQELETIIQKQKQVVEVAEKIAAVTTETARVISSVSTIQVSNTSNVPSGMCRHPSHGEVLVPGVQLLPGYGSACAFHQPPKSPLDTMSFGQADAFSRVWKQWERSWGTL